MPGAKRSLVQVASPPARHERVSVLCETLVALARHVIAHGADSWARETAGRVLRFFDPMAGHPGISPVWKILRARLARIEAGESEWIRNTEVQRFVRFYAETIEFETGRARVVATRDGPAAD